MLLQSIVCVSRRGAGVVKQAEVIGFVDVDVDVSRMLVDRHGDEHGRHMPSSLPTRNQHILEETIQTAERFTHIPDQARRSERKAW